MITIFLTLILVFVLQLLFYSWWWIILVPLLLGFMEKDSVARAALGTGLGVFILWTGMGLYQWIQGGHVIVRRITEVMGVGSGGMLVLITGVLGLLVAALAGYAGFSLRKLLIKEYQIS